MSSHSIFYFISKFPNLFISKITKCILIFELVTELSPIQQRGNKSCYIVMNASWILFVVNCSLGSFYEDGKCKPCDEGTYQDGEGQSTCKLCRSSNRNGSSAIYLTQCKGKQWIKDCEDKVYMTPIQFYTTMTQREERKCTWHRFGSVMTTKCFLLPMVFIYIHSYITQIIFNKVISLI